MRWMTILIGLAILLVGCSTKSATVKTHPAEEGDAVLNRGEMVAADNHLEQGKALYHKGHYQQAIKHLIRAVSNNYKSWEAHYYLGLCQQRLEQHDRAIGSFNNCLKFGPSDKLTMARISYCLGYSWEQEGYYYKAAERYASALQMNPDYIEARYGVERVRVKAEKAEAKKESGEGNKAK